MMKKIAQGIKRMFGSRVFSRLIVYYILLIAVFASMCGFSYYQAMNMSLENLVDRNQLIFENSAVTLQNTFRTIESFTTNLYDLDQLQQLMSRTSRESQGKTIDIYEAIRVLPVLNDVNGLLSGYFVYIPGGDYIVAPGQGFSSLERYYEAYFALSSQQSYQQWHDQVLSGEGKSIHASWQDGSEIQYAMPLSNSVTGGVPSKVVYKISSKNLLRQLSRSFTGGTECALIADMEGKILAASSGSDALIESLEGSFPEESSGVREYSVSGVRYMLSYQAVPKFGVQMMILVPYSVVVAQAKESIRGIVMILVWLLMAGLVAIVIVVLSNVLPLMKIADRVTETETDAKGMWLIPEAFSRMESSKQVLEKRVEEQKLHLRNACINRLMHGNVLDPYNLEEMLRCSDLPLKGSRFCGVLIEFNNTQPEAVSRALILELLNEYSEHLTFLTFESLNVVACLYFQGEDEQTDARMFFGHIYEAMKSACGFDAVFYVGIPCEQLERIPESFSTAEWLMRISQHNEWLCMAENDSRSINLRCILSPDTEKKIENCVMMGEREAVAQILEEIYRRNFVENNIQGFWRQFLYCRLVGILATCNANLSEEESIPDQVMQLAGREFFLWISESFAVCCERACNKSNQRSQRLIDDVRQYIEENYTNYELSLNSLAFHFGITGNYLSGLFKKQLGMNFSVYLERVRIEHAEELLSGTNQTIDEIACQIGYANSDSFRRAFRRVRGVSPSQFRDRTEEGASAGERPSNMGGEET